MLSKSNLVGLFVHNNFNFNTLSCQNYFFPEDMGGGGGGVAYIKIPEGWGVIFVLKQWKLRGGRGDVREIPSLAGEWIFSGTTQPDDRSVS